jgi:hypothetical protein
MAHGKQLEYRRMVQSSQKGGNIMNTKRMLSLAVILMSFSLVGMTQEKRQVTVNGFDLTQAEIQFMEQLHCGPIPNGRYWFNYLTGMWGDRENAPAQAYISAPCVQEIQENDVAEHTDHSLVTAHDLCPHCFQRLP